MTRFLTRGAIGVAVLGMMGAGEQQPVFRATSDAVRVFVTVTDQTGRLITALPKEQFEILDNKRPQAISLFDNSPQPIRLVVMLDVSGSMEGNLLLLRAAADELFVRLRTDDRVRVGTFGHAVQVSPWLPRDPEALRSTLPTTIAPDAPTPLWRAVDTALDAFQDTDDERRVVLVLSDGKDSGPGAFRPPYPNEVDVIERARSDDAMVYGIGIRSRLTKQPVPADARSGSLRRRALPGIGPGALQAMMDAERPDPGLARLAHETGGGYTEIYFGQELGPAFARLADELHRQYLIAFAPPERDGRLHTVDVRVTADGLTPRARKSYVAPGP